MKNFKKILVVALACVLMLATCIIAASATNYKGTTKRFDKLVSTAEGEASFETMFRALKEVGDYLIEEPVDPADEDYADIWVRLEKVYSNVFSTLVANASNDSLTIQKRADDLIRAGMLVTRFDFSASEKSEIQTANTEYEALCVSIANELTALLDPAVEENLKTAENGVNANRLIAILNGCPMVSSDTATAYAPVHAAADELLAAQSRAIAQNYLNMEKGAKLTDYDLSVNKNENFEKQSLSTHTSDTTISGFGSALKTSGKNTFGVNAELNGNKYLYLEYHFKEDDANGNSFWQLNLAGYNAANGLTMEFKFATFDYLPTSGIKVEPGSVSGSGNVFPPEYMFVSADGGIGPSESLYATKSLADVIVPGQWIDIIITTNATTYMRDIYIQGQLVFSTDVSYPGLAYSLNSVAWRFNATSNSGGFSVDDAKVYGGSSYRVVDRFETMTEDESFLFYYEYLKDDTRDVNGRQECRNRMEKLIAKYWDGSAYTEKASTDELKAAVDYYNAFDFDALLASIKTENLKEYKALVDFAASIERRVETTSTRLTAIDNANNFGVTYKDSIDKTTDSDGNGKADYLDYNSMLMDVSDQVTLDQNAVVFTRYMQRFENAFTLVARERYIALAKAMVKNSEIDIQMATDPDALYRENFLDFVDAYEYYLNADAVLKEQQRTDNSEKILTAATRLSRFDGLDWDENAAEIRKILTNVRPSVKADDDGNLPYDPYAVGLADALVTYNRYFSYFLAIDQVSHEVYLNEILDLIASTDSYIEKLGMASLMRKYLHDNDIDYDKESIKQIVIKLDTVEAELALREEDYAAVLRQNSGFFINLVERMRIATSYVDQKELYNEGMEYYLSIDITVEGASEAVKIYEKVGAELALKEENAVAFLDAKARYDAAETEADKYAALVMCYDTSRYAEPTYPGVSEASSSFKTAYDAYVGYANAVNADIAAAGTVIGSLRSISGVTPIIAVIIKKIFG